MRKEYRFDRWRRKGRFDMQKMAQGIVVSAGTLEHAMLKATALAEPGDVLVRDSDYP